MKSSCGFEVYVHIPFCVRKCDYCDFVSFASNNKTKEGYFNALLKQIELRAEAMGKVPVTSVFFGGGTPSLVDPWEIGRVLTKLRECFDVQSDAEITIEMNPNSGDYKKLCKYIDFGINRLSIGLQSANNQELTTLSRVHTYEEFLETYESARKAGFKNINVDLMSGLPGQSIESYKDTLLKVIELGPEHISAYSLIIEEGTPFYDRYKNGNGLPSEDVDREMYSLTKEVLEASGYERYEISNYSKPGFECRHNLGYWTRVPYMGFGIAAASLIGNKRLLMHSDLNRYIKNDYTESIEELTNEDIMEEFMFLGLRLCKGVSKESFFEAFGVRIESVYGDTIEKLTGEGLLVADKRIYLTDKGLDLANYCMAEFIR